MFVSLDSQRHLWVDRLFSAELRWIQLKRMNWAN